MGRFRKKPVEVDAIRWTGANPNRVKAFTGEQALIDYGTGELKIPTLEGVMTAQIGDWIIRGIQDEFYPCKPDIFEATYEEVS